MPSPYKILHLEQNSEEWFRWRTGGIGASDAPVIMGESPFKSIEALYNEKLHGSRVTLTPAMARGLRMEPGARKAYCENRGVQVEALCIEHYEHGWMRASLDGISACGQHLVEIKCGEATYKQAKRGKIMPCYRAQLQHQLFVTGLKAMDYWCWTGGKRGICLTVERDEDYMERLFAREAAFLESLRARGYSP
ncbi:YqaJ viral recombinase family protein [Myxococcota bacterium]|nr:YqaJ viral recombinase family protein [Myxococcota bacterium]